MAKISPVNLMETAKSKHKVAGVKGLELINYCLECPSSQGNAEGVQYGYTAKSTAGKAFNFFSALGAVAFTYAGHNLACLHSCGLVLLPSQSTLQA
ncbi:hypothetical protein U1Q18_025058 [Sarracenia purpurea var. burkii]